MQHGDVFDLIGSSSTTFVPGVVSKVQGLDVYVLTGFSETLTIGPVRYAGATPNVGEDVLLGVVVDTGEGWIVSRDAPGAGSSSGLNGNVDTITPSDTGGGPGPSTGTSDPIPHFLGTTPRAVLLTAVATFDTREDYIMTVRTMDSDTFTAGIRVANAEVYGYAGDPVSFFWLALA